MGVLNVVLLVGLNEEHIGKFIFIVCDTICEGYFVIFGMSADNCTLSICSQCCSGSCSTFDNGDSRRSFKTKAIRELILESSIKRFRLSLHYIIYKFSAFIHLISVKRLIQFHRIWTHQSLLILIIQTHWSSTTLSFGSSSMHSIASSDIVVIIHDKFIHVLFI